MPIKDLGLILKLELRAQTKAGLRLNSRLVLKVRGPAAILFISRDTCSGSIAKAFACLFLWGIARISRDMLQIGVSPRCVCVKLSTKRGYRTILGGMLTSLKKYRAIWGIAAIVWQHRSGLRTKTGFKASPKLRVKC